MAATLALCRKLPSACALGPRCSRRRYQAVSEGSAYGYAVMMQKEWCIGYGTRRQ